MSRYFMRDTNLAGMESAMMLPPLFKPRQSGLAILNRFRYTKESTDCRDCTQWQKKECSAERCPWLVERLEAGNISYGELLKECFRDLNDKHFQVRLQRLARKFYGSLFKDKKHQRRFELAKNSLRILFGKTPDCHTAALFLLTADEKLWQLVKNVVTADAIHFEHTKLGGIGTEGYTLFQMARTLSTGQTKITVSELADAELISDPLLAVLVGSMLIARFGADVLGVKR